MIRQLAFVFALLLAQPVLSQETAAPSALDQWREDPSVVLDGTALDLTEFVWIARPVVVFADTPEDPRFRQQMELLTDRVQDLVDRDVVLIVDTDPVAMGPLRTRLRPRGFMLVIMGKDGEIELRKPAPWDVREISRTIDKMPLRRQEIDEERTN